MQGGSLPFAVPRLSQPMSLLSSNLTARRESLGLDVKQVHQALNRRGVDVAYSTVAGWFNGNRGVRNMEHLKALCAVLETDLNSLVSGEMEVVEDALRISVVREMDSLTEAQREAVLALVRSMRGSVK
jgi:transcriptional regulator with XRE-family HTH domain